MVGVNWIELSHALLYATFGSRMIAHTIGMQGSTPERLVHAEQDHMQMRRLHDRPRRPH
jgi:hypothetical protein